MTSPSAPHRSARAPVLLAAVVAAVAAILAFLPALDAGFVDFDDTEIVVRNEFIRGVTPDHLAWMLRTTHTGHYAPLTWISLALDAAPPDAELDPLPFHRTNLLLHGLNAALVVLVCARLLAAARPDDARAHPVALSLAALAAGLAWAVHPLRAETVAWITERRGLLGALFLLLALLAWLRAFPAGSVRTASRTAYVASIALLLLSLLSKGLGMTFAGVVVLLDVVPLRRLPADPRRWLEPALRPVWVQKLPVVLLGAASAVSSGLAARSVLETAKSLEAWGPLARLAQAGYGLLFYVRKTLWPADLAALYELPDAFDRRDPRFLLGLAVAVAFLPLLALLARRALPLVVAIAVYALCLAPVLGFAQAGPQLVADRYSYVACIPFSVLLGAGLLAIATRPGSGPPKVAVAALAVAGIGALAIASRGQAAVWHDPRSLWEHALAAGEPSSVLHNNLGTVEARAGNLDRAAEHFRASLAIRPGQGRAWFNLGTVHEMRGNLAAAEQAFLEASRTMQPAWDPLCRLGSLYLEQPGRLEDAVRVFRAALADVEGPSRAFFSPLPHLGLGKALARSGEREKARALLEFAARFPQTREEAMRELAR